MGHSNGECVVVMVELVCQRRVSEPVLQDNSSRLTEGERPSLMVAPDYGRQHLPESDPDKKWIERIAACLPFLCLC